MIDIIGYIAMAIFILLCLFVMIGFVVVVLTDVHAGTYHLETEIKKPAERG